MNKKKLILYSVVIIILAMASASSFYAYESLTLDREQQTPVTEDEDGIISINAQEEIGVGDEKFLTTIQNPLNHNQIVTIRLPNNLWTFPDGTSEKTINLDSNQQQDIYVQISNNANNNQQLEYQIESTNNEGDFLLSTDRTITVINLINIEGEVQSPGSSGLYKFTITNEGNRNVYITGIGIDATSNEEAIKVSQGDIYTINGEQFVNQDIYVGGSTRSLTQNFQLNSSESVSMEFDRFQRPEDEPGRPNADMSEESVTVKFEFMNNPSQQVLLQ